MSPVKSDFPSVRACIFDNDGLLIDTEDIYTFCSNQILASYGKPNLPWEIKARMMGRPVAQSAAIFEEWAQLPVSRAEYAARLSQLQSEHFPNAKPLPGVEKLLTNLVKTLQWDEKSNDDGNVSQAKPHRVHIALASGSHSVNFRYKTQNLKPMYSVFPPESIVLGDDARVEPGRGKPLPDVLLVALKTLNDALPAGAPPIKPEECLVFEDSVSGVEAARRAGMRVIWCPHPKLREVYADTKHEVLAGRTNQNGISDQAVDPRDGNVGEIDDGWAETLASLEDFSYEKYGIVIPQDKT